MPDITQSILWQLITFLYLTEVQNRPAPLHYKLNYKFLCHSFYNFLATRAALKVLQFEFSY